MDRSNLTRVVAPLHTEFNVARLGLISIQQRLPSTAVLWEAGTLIDGQAGSIRCKAGEGSQVPHGIDGDLISAIITLYYANGSPESRLVQTNLRELMRVAHIKQLDGRHYEIFRASLNRVNQAAYHIDSAWKRKGVPGRLDAKFYLVESLTGWRRDQPLIPGREEEDLVIGLSPHLAYSAASGYVLSTQPAVMRTLSSAGARGQYRLIEALRADPEDPGHLAPRLTLSLQDFVGYARLLGGAQDAYRVRRIVEPTLAQLHASGYLHRYDVVGTGPNTQFVLDFGDATQIVDHHSVKLLESLGVAHRMALQLALGHSRAEIEATCWVTARNAERVRFKPGAKQVENLPGLIVTKLRSGEGPSAIKAMRDQQKKAVVVTRPKAILPEAPLPDAPPDTKTLRFLTRGMTFPAPLYTRLETLFLSGSVKAHDVTSLRGADTEQIEKQVAVWELHK